MTDSTKALYGYARLANAGIVCINDIHKEFADSHKKEFSCPYCNNKMYATFGATQIWHFRHDGDPCDPSNYIHSTAERLFLDEYLRCLNENKPFYLEWSWCNEACVVNSPTTCPIGKENHLFDLTKAFTKATIEKTVNLFDGRRRRPDVLLETNDGLQLWIEIWVSHETDSIKQKDGHIVEIRICGKSDLDRFREMVKEHRITPWSENKDNIRQFGLDSAFFKRAGLPSMASLTFPCDKFFCFVVTPDGRYKTSLILPSNVDSAEPGSLLYRIVLRLNWWGKHDSVNKSERPRLDEEILKDFCEYRYKHNITPSSYHHIEDLVLYEKRAPLAINTSPLEDGYLSIPITQTECASIIDFDIEWVDLGLPSRTRWASQDISSHLSFHEALRNYRLSLPTKQQIDELQYLCSIFFDCDSRCLRLTGPNGNSISFHIEKKFSYYWLNDYDEGDYEFGQCALLYPDHLYTTNTFSDSLHLVRLVNNYSK